MVLSCAARRLAFASVISLLSLLLLLSIEWRPHLIGLDHLPWRSFHNAAVRKLQFPVNVQSLTNENSSEVDCVHGVYNPRNKTCSCDAGWTGAGITDTINFLEGKCEQYKCQSHEMCEEVMRIPGAWCPIRGWNCYCGWAYAFADGGEGYETKGRHGGKCMGVMYTFSVSISILLKHFMTHAWKVFVMLALGAIPFGRKRANCDHHRPSLWRGIRKCVGCPSECRGQCVMSAASFTLDSLQDDFAWSIYALDLGVWSYLFMVTLWVIAESIWSIVLWTLVMVIIILSAICGMIAMCGEGLGSCEASMGCGDCCGAGAAAGGADGVGCMDCCGLCVMHTGHSTGTALSSDVFYWGGTFPYDPWWGYSGYGYDHGGGRDSCCGGCCAFFCRPIAWLFYVFPAMPENMWGGLVGLIFGTHIRTPPERLYQGGNPVIECMSMAWRRNTDLHDDDTWRDQVYNFLTQEYYEDNSGMGLGAQGFHASQNQRRAGSQNASEMQTLLMEDGVQRRMIQIGLAHVVITGEVFKQEEHHCVQSSYEDYEKNECWICTQGNEEWDLWLSCKHVFCKACSTEMLKRRMPCPLCRVSSSTILRGQAVDAVEFDRRRQEEERRRQEEERRRQEEERKRQEERMRIEAEALRKKNLQEEEERRKAQEESDRLRTLQEESIRRGRIGMEDRVDSQEPLLSSDQRSQSSSTPVDVLTEVVVESSRVPIQVAKSARTKEDGRTPKIWSEDRPKDLLGEPTTAENPIESSSSKPSKDEVVEDSSSEVAKQDAEKLARERAEKQKQVEELEARERAALAEKQKQMLGKEKELRESREQREKELIQQRNLIKKLELEAARKQAEALLPTRVQVGKEKAIVTADSGIDISKVLGSKQFQEWAETVGKERRIVITKLHIQSLDMFGPRIGSVKFQADARISAQQIPGIVFMRGGAAAILVLLQHQGQNFTLVMRQPRVPVCLPSVAEIPAGVLDGDSNFAGVAAKELEEKIGMRVGERDLIDLTQIAYEDRFSGVFPSCGASYEFTRIFLYQRTVTQQELEDLSGRLRVVSEEGETIKLEIIPLEQLWRISPDAKALAALALYEKLRAAGRVSMSPIDVMARVSEASVTDKTSALEEINERNLTMLAAALEVKHPSLIDLAASIGDTNVSDIASSLRNLDTINLEKLAVACETAPREIEHPMKLVACGEANIVSIANVLSSSSACSLEKVGGSSIETLQEDTNGTLCLMSIASSCSGASENEIAHVLSGLSECNLEKLADAVKAMKVEVEKSPSLLMMGVCIGNASGIDIANVLSGLDVSNRKKLAMALEAMQN